MADKKKSPSPAQRSWGAWLILLLIIVFAASIRIRVADMALERDEGEYAYAGQLLLQGIPPYKLAYNMKLPGTYAAYAVLMSVFGETTRGIHLGMVLINAATIVLIFLLGRKLLNPVAGLVSAASFALLSNSQTFLGMAAHANHFVVLFAVAGLLALLHAHESNRPMLYFWSAILLGLAFLMKQQGLFFVLFGFCSIAIHLWRTRPLNWKQSSLSLSSFCIGSIVPFGLTCLALWGAGVFDKFWFWTFKYAREYVATVPASQAFEIFWPNFTYTFQFTWAFWILALAGLNLLLVLKSLRWKALWLAVLLLFSIGALSVGFYYRMHYFLLVLPPICLLAGGFVGCFSSFLANKALGQGIMITLFVALFGQSVYLHRDFFFRMSPRELTVALYSDNPFSRAEAVANYIRDHSAKDARIAVMGSEPEIYFLAHRHSATGYMYTYGLMEPQPFALQMQKEMAQEIEASAPEYIVMVKFDFSWLHRPDSNEFILEWLGRYTNKAYDLEAVLDFMSPTQVEESWGPENIKHEPRGSDYILLFHRKPLPK